MTSAYRALPSVDAVLRHSMMTVTPDHPRDHLVAAVRQALDEARAAIVAGEDAPNLEAVAARASALSAVARRPALRPVINATGVILQTNFGRAPLARSALEAMVIVASGYSNLEFDLEQGKRGSRQTAIGRRIAEVTGADAGMAVNNNAAAVLLTLAALVSRREVLVSRGQLVEIGGGFRIPDVLAQSGARLIEVGTTNRTYAHDYAAAVTPDTAAILRVHPSNFVQQGFTHQPELAELVAVARDRGLLLIDDLGSGALLDTANAGLAHEPMAQESVAAGADVICFSGDKLLGGPQSGLVAGQAEPLAAMARHPLARAVRIDKLSLAALDATLLHYLLGDAVQEVPVWRMIHCSVADIAARAATWTERLRAAGVQAEIVPGVSTVGGGSLPGETLPTRLVAITIADVDRFAHRLRAGQPAVVGRIHRDQFLLDPRTVLPEEDAALLERVEGKREG